MLDSCAGSLFVPSSDTHILYEGRVIKNPDHVSFCYPGTAVRLFFKGSSISANLKCNAGYYWVEIDSLKPFKLSTYCNHCQADSSFLLANDLNSSEHCVQLTLVNEGLECQPVFYGFKLDKSGLLLNPVRKTHAIEFIGNSITCGYGVEAHNKEEEFSDSTENFIMSFAGLVSRRFNLETMVVARSGIGVYRNFGDPVSGSLSPLPSFYDQCFIYRSPKWNFSNFTPDLICVCLGTNDLSQGEYDLHLFESALSSFLSHLHTIYPEAKIVLANSPMLHEQRLLDQHKVLDRVASSLNRKEMFIYRLNFSEQDDSLGYGANWHPSADRQQNMADELSSFIKQIFPNW